jgi:hypothetical protein
MMDTYVSGTTRSAASPPVALALALPAMLTTWVLSQPDILGHSPADANPIAGISDVGQTVVGQSISLDAKASFDPTNSGSPLQYAWNFGDGTTASGVSVSHTYRTTGNYTLTLTVISTSGKRIISKLLNVGTSPNTYSNPYSPLGGTNHFNPAVTLPVANNNLPLQPPLHPPLAPLQTATPVPTTSTPVPTSTTGAINRAPTPIPPTPTTGAADPSLFLLVVIGMGSGIIIAVTGLLAFLVLRRIRRQPREIS